MTTSEDEHALRAERRERLKATTPEQRLQWLRETQEFAFRSGAWERAMRRRHGNGSEVRK